MNNNKDNKLLIYQVLVRLAGNTNPSCIPYGSIEQNGCGKFNDFSSLYLSRIRELGATHIWLTGVIEHATCQDYSSYGIRPDNPRVVKGMAGSPYAIKDYYDVDPDLAVDIPNRMKEFEDLVERCHQAGLAPLIDFVPNHLARQYYSDSKPGKKEDFGDKDDTGHGFRPSNNFYYIPGRPLLVPMEVNSLPYVRNLWAEDYREYPARATGNDQFHENPGFNDWYETVKLNYGVDYTNNRKKHLNPVPDTWKKMLEILLFWASRNVSGFRCDMAEMVPVEFWEWVIPKVKKEYQDVIFIAEIYNPDAYRTYIHQGKFDYLYDKVGLYDFLRSVVEQKQPANVLSNTWKTVEGIEQHMLRFIENHDEQRVASRFFGKSARAGVPATVVSALISTGPFMMYFGQETGEPAAGISGYSGDDGRTTIFDYFAVPTYQEWFNKGACNGLTEGEPGRLRDYYSRLMRLCKDPIISHGHFYDLMWANNSSSGFNDQHFYAFSRWDDNNIWLVISSFHPHSNLEIQLNLPEHFFQTSNLKELSQEKVSTVLPPFAGETRVLAVGKDHIKIQSAPFDSLVLSVKNEVKIQEEGM